MSSCLRRCSRRCCLRGSGKRLGMIGTKLLPPALSFLSMSLTPAYPEHSAILGGERRAETGCGGLQRP